MTRKRLRPAHSDEQLAAIYATPHDHRRWRDHLLRVDTTISVGRWLLEASGTFAQRGADLSCGNGAILGALGIPTNYYGDYASGYEITGPIEKTIHEIPGVDMFVCSETLEHLDDPDAVLSSIRDKTNFLLLSTPVDCWADDNVEHYWAWSRADVEDMMAAAGFRPFIYTEVDFRPMGLPYSFGIWGSR